MAGKRRKPSLEVVHPDCAGIDIGKRAHYVAVDPEGCDSPVRRFGTFTGDLEGMAEWLRERGVREVAMESTGVYWIPVFELLDRAGFDVHLVNPRATRQTTGRKSDVEDCQWIRQLMRHGLLRGAFRAPDANCPLRSYLRQRGELVRQRARAVQHAQKALVQMNVQLDNVLSDVMGVTGQRILRAIVAGERDGEALAKFRDGRCRADRATIAASLAGNWRAEHLFALGQALERFDACEGQIAACDERIDGELDRLARDDVEEPPPDRRARKGRERKLKRRLKRALGVDLTAIPTVGIETALTIAAEIGADLSRFASVGHFCSWLGLAPETRVSGDRRLKGGKRRPANRVGQALRMAATSARSDRSAIGAAHRRRMARMDTAKAVKATAHQLARLVYRMLTRGEEYVARDIAEWEAERRDRTVANLQRQAHRFDLELVPIGSS